MSIKYLVVDKEELRSLELETYFDLQGIHNYTDQETYYNNTKKALETFTGPNDIVVVLHIGLFWRSKQKSDLTNEIKKYILSLEDNWIIAGNIINEYESKKLHSNLGPVKGKSFFKIWPQLTIINMRAWRKIGMPNFGYNQKCYGKDLPSVTVSDDNIHDTYTPVYIEKGPDEYFSEHQFVAGNECWNIIKESLENNYKVLNLPGNIRSKIVYTYPEDNYDEYKKTIKRYQKKVIKRLDNIGIKAKGNQKLVSTLNNLKHFQWYGTDHLSPFNSEKLYTPEWRDQRNIDMLKDVDCIVQPCQGWKSLVYSHGKISNMPNGQPPIQLNNTKCDYVFFDFKEQRVDAKRYWNERWDGTVNWPKKLKKQCEFGEKEMNGRNELATLFDSLPEAITQFQKHQSHYLPLNILQDDGCNILNSFLRAKRYKKVLFLYSNIWTWHWNVILFGKEGCAKRMDTSIKLISRGINSFYTEGKGVIDEDIHITKIR